MSESLLPARDRVAEAAFVAALYALLGTITYYFCVGAFGLHPGRFYAGFLTGAAWVHIRTIAWRTDG